MDSLLRASQGSLDEDSDWTRLVTEIERDQLYIFPLGEIHVVVCHFIVSSCHGSRMAFETPRGLRFRRRNGGIYGAEAPEPRKRTGQVRERPLNRASSRPRWTAMYDRNLRQLLQTGALRAKRGKT